MRRWDAGAVAGVLLVVLGLLFLLQTVSRASILTSEALWGVLFGGAGIAFLSVFRRDRAHWWAILPGLPLLAVGLLLLMEAFVPRLVQAFGGFLFLALLSLAFWVVYSIRREFWWAIIPGGVLATLALIDLIAWFVPQADDGGLLFLGLGLTFLALYLLPATRGRQSWAIVPAAILLVFAGGTALSFGVLGPYVWPILLILGGLFLILRYRRPAA